MDKINLFGCVAYNLTPKENRSSKLDKRNKRMIMIGYANNSYRLWNPIERKEVHGRNVVFNEMKQTQ